MTRRLGLLAVALLIAIVGTSAVFTYVNRVEASTLAGAEPVDVLVAAQRMPAGTSPATAVEQKLVTVASMPRRSVPEGALASLDAVGEQTLVSDVFAGEVLLRAKFADQTAKTGKLLIPNEKIALSVELGDPQRVAGFVVPGSEIAVFVTLEDRTRLLLPRASVIAVGPATLRAEPDGDGEDGKGSGEAMPKAVLTVAVDQPQAERLVHAAQTGELYLGLLSTTSKTGPGTGVTTTALFQ